MTIKMLLVLSVLFKLLAMDSKLQAADFYIDQNNPAANDQNSGAIDSPWKTLSKANQTLKAGDTVFIKKGTYNTFIAPANSGTSTLPLTFRNYASDNVIIANATYGILLSGKSNVVVQGINFYNLDNFLVIQNGSNFNTIAYCNFDQGRNMGWSGSVIYQNSSRNRVHHCRFSKYGECTADGNDRGSVLDIGNEESMTAPSNTPDHSDYNLIENNNFFHGGHHVIGVFSRFNVIRNNNIHNEAWSRGKGNRNIALSGYPIDSGWNLIEANNIGYASPPCDSWGASSMLLTTANNIIRRNRFFFNDLAGIEMSVTSTYYSDIVYNKIYNNTFFHNGWNMATGPDAATSAIAFAYYSGPKVIKFNSIINNLYYSHYQVYGYYNVNPVDQHYAGNWNGDNQGNPMFANATKVLGDPMDINYPNLNLQEGSLCIDAGTYLTTIISADGNGKAFMVKDSGYFMDGWGIRGLKGDEIQILGTSQKARIVTIDYNTNTITVDSDITWKQNQKVSLVYAGSAPDIGAFEFNLNFLSSPKNVRIVNQNSAE